MEMTKHWSRKSTKKRAKRGYKMKQNIDQSHIFCSVIILISFTGLWAYFVTCPSLKADYLINFPER